MALWSKVDNEAGKPKYLSDTLRNEQTVSDKDATAGVDVAEATAAVNRAKGIKTPGWTEYRTYTDAQGNTRHKAEVLVAFAGDFTSGDNDTLAPEITITGQPSNTTVISGATGSFSVTATRTGTGTLTYQWQKQESGAGAWSNVSGATSSTYTTGALTVAADNTDKYRVIVSLVNAESVTSNAVTLTVNPAVINISAQPQNATAAEGETATFSVTAAADGGATVAYQWQVSTDTGETWSNVTGATSASYTTDTLVAGDDGKQYRVAVSADKEAVTVNSAAVTLTVTSV
jgi:hypothetical protein